MATPYVGVTGLMTDSEVKDVLKMFTDAGYSLHSDHIPMLGFLVSQKTLDGEKTKNRRYPAIDSLRKLLEPTYHRALAMMHFNSKAPDIAAQVMRVLEPFYDEGLCRALQLNIAWPDQDQVCRIKTALPDLKVVFQLSHKMTEGKSVQEVVECMRAYDDLIDYALIDPSGGRSLEFDVQASYQLYSGIREQFPTVTVGFAGGFTKDNVGDRVQRLMILTGSSAFCIDVEGGVRDKISDAYGDDILNKTKVAGYIQQTSTVLR